MSSVTVKRASLNSSSGGTATLGAALCPQPAVSRALCDLIIKLRSREGRLIGMVSTPGDRKDDDMRELERIARRAFDVVVLRECPDGRERAPGEVMRPIAEGVAAVDFPFDGLHQVPDEIEAVDFCLRMASRTGVPNGGQGLMDEVSGADSLAGAEGHGCAAC
jgi:UDP-N-acetylmuramyl tripeptide synthase